MGILWPLQQVVFRSRNKAFARPVDRGTFLMNVFLCFASINYRDDTSFGKQGSQQVRLTVWIYPTPIKVS